MTVQPGKDLVDPGALERLNRIGGQEFLVEMIELFLEHSPQRLDAAREAYRDGEVSAVYRAAHSLKSTAANLGASALQDAAARVEDRAAAEPPLRAGPPRAGSGAGPAEGRRHVSPNRGARS